MGFIRLISSSSCAENSEIRTNVQYGKGIGSYSIFHANMQFQIVDRVHLFRRFHKVSPVGAFPSSTFHLPLRELVFTRLFDKRAFGLHVRVRLTDEEEKFGDLLCPFGQAFRIEVREVDMDVRRGNGFNTRAASTYSICSICRGSAVCDNQCCRCCYAKPLHFNVKCVTHIADMHRPLRGMKVARTDIHT